jgi:hypothetical protein
MTPGARELLTKCSRQTVIVSSGDPRWEAIVELQRAGLVRLEWKNEGRMRAKASASAGIVVTDAGRAELAREAKP